MSEGLKNTIIFAVGAAVGSAVTWKLIKTKYEQIANEEIASVKETYAKKSLEEIEEKSDDDYEEIIDEDEIKNLAEIISQNGYNEEESIKEGLENMVKGPYVISPDEYDENDYETETLYYYPDGVLTDTYDNVIEDVEGTVGKKSLKHFGEYEEDSVFVRNDDLETDYEILLQPDDYEGE